MGSGVIVRFDWSDEPDPRRWRLLPGESLTFGRGDAEVPVDLVLGDPAISGLAGEIRATRDYWEISNASQVSSYVVEDIGHAGRGHAVVPPGRVWAPMPYETSRVRVPGERGEAVFVVLAPWQRLMYSTVRTGRTTRPFGIDETSVHFLVLVAFCEPRLKEPDSPVIPSAAEVHRRLRPFATDESKPSWVYHHVDYLVEEKLGLTNPGLRRGQDWKIRALVEHALQFGLVRERHADLLPRE